jgi:RecB family exonuclease
MAKEFWRERPFSQAALGTFQVCPLRFRYRYIDDLYWSSLWGSNPEERAAVERGQLFHLLARRYYSGLLPAVWDDPVLAPPLARWLDLLKGFLPYDPSRLDFYPEQELRLSRPDLRLLARYDLLTVDRSGRAVIYDWKTERRLPRRDYFLNHIQTIVYRYVLVAAGGAYAPEGAFAPEQVAVTYWNPLHPDRWETYPYTSAQYERDGQLLQQLVGRILQTPPEGFLATPDLRVCRACEYAPVCHGKKPEELIREEEELLFEEGIAWDRLPELVD